MNEQQKMLDYLINERVSRAVQRVFSQNRPEKISQSIFAGLQNRIRNNSNELRQTLYRKYNSLINCSELLDGLSSFASDLNGISQSMSKIIREKQFEYQDVTHLRSKIQKIQYEMHKNKFQQAMNIACQGNTEQKQQDTQQDQYYLQYLKVQIIQTMERYINSTKFDTNLISNVINTLSKFVLTTEASVFKDIINGRSRQLLNFLYSYVDYSSQTKQIISEQSLISCIFQYKLTTLGYCNSQQLIFNFFNDLLELSQENNEQRLRTLFLANWKEMGENLSHIFIHRVQQPTGIKFEYQLYQKLVRSERFTILLQKIENNLGLSQQKHIIESFQTLWQDYYHQLIDHVIQQINPLTHIKKLQENSKMAEAIPFQFLPYKVDTSIQQTFKIRKKYQKILISVKNSMNLLCQKGDNLKICQLFQKKIQILNQMIVDYVKQNNESKYQICFLQLRKAVLLSILCSDFNKLQDQQLQEKCWATGAKLSVNGYLNRLSNIFNDKNKTFESNMIQMDSFFTCYSVPNLKLRDLQVIKKVVLEIIRSLQSENPDLSQRYELIIKKLLNQKQPISIYKSSLPNISQYVFHTKITSQELAFDNQTYKKYLKKSSKKRTTALIEQNIQQKISKFNIQEDFEIGEKETVEDMVKIGMKSMKTMGKFISGFIKKN